ncbi:hypothetical protein [Pseudomonas aeruginosa]|uniref:hypothetical protein n=1 Tax=Pseudomonas aeruginosa TaxID=287 RepID=UPI00336A6F46
MYPSQLSIRPFNEWMILAKSASKKELEVMCHSVLLETGSMLEKANVISQKEFRDLFLNSGYTDLMVDGAPLPHQPDTIIRWLIDRLRS